MRNKAPWLGSDIVSGAWLNALTHQPMHLVFCDPPYAMVEDPLTLPPLLEILQKFAQAGLMEAQGMMVLRTPDRVLPPSIPGWQDPDIHTYGKMHLGFYRVSAPLE
ncbi:MAG: hypothetical protein HC898_11215 [Phycisphaerales bacterium]|nr:hypothetical protein [Phycisphaerales bacterium]